MDRRQFLRAALTMVAGSTLDVDRLLWIPGEKKIFIPSPQQLSFYNQIIAIELERILPRLPALFERDATFYALLKPKLTIEGSEMKLPLIVDPGKFK